MSNSTYNTSFQRRFSVLTIKQQFYSHYTGQPMLAGTTS